MKTKLKKAYSSVKMAFISKFNSLVSKLHRKDKKYFKRGDLVETKTKERGRVWKVYRNAKTNEITACTVIWEEKYKGQAFTLLVPVEDKGKRFNPVIKKVQNG